MLLLGLAPRVLLRCGHNVRVELLTVVRHAVQSVPSFFVKQAGLFLGTSLLGAANSLLFVLGNSFSPTAGNYHLFGAINLTQRRETFQIPCKSGFNREWPQETGSLWTRCTTINSSFLIK